jgi:prepilin-type N-terminal cleavage/methylation domain-containing protein
MSSARDCRVFKKSLHSHTASGFTLVEMSIVVVIAGIILLALIPALMSLRRDSQLSATQTNLQTLLRSTAAYALANGCLPCPTPASALGSGNRLGKVRGDNAASPLPCGACAVADGISPFVSLGLDPSQARDGWGRFITMHVDPQLAVSPCSATDIANQVTGCRSTDTRLCRAQKIDVGILLTLSNSGTTVGNIPASVLFLSHGENGYGAYRNSPDTSNQLRLPVPADRPLEAANVKAAGDASHTFRLVDRGAYFDDVMVYANRNALLTLLGNTACLSSW